MTQFPPHKDPGSMSYFWLYNAIMMKWDFSLTNLTLLDESGGLKLENEIHLREGKRQLIIIKSIF